MKPLARFVLPAALLVSTSALACMNDRDSDSLALQAQQLPETLRVITGRFERNPPLYYQMRIARSQQQLQQNPKQFALYDDIGVAFDKIGRADDALKTMQRKRQFLPAFNAKDKANKEAWYRYFANVGTFRAHRWLKAGAPQAKLGEMKTARAQIKRAIEIKPDAHFGRERYQLMAMDWIVARKSGKTDKTLGQWVGARDGWKESNRLSTLQNSNRTRAVEGMAGLIVLGGAWQSPDIFEALAAALETTDGVTLRYLALLRAQELDSTGKTSFVDFKIKTSNSPYLDYSQSAGSGLVNDIILEEDGVGINDKNKERLNALLPQLRTEADAWNATRQNWMTAQLKTGAHPDTNPNFWNGYRESAPPSLDIKWENQRQQTETAMKRGMVLIYGLLSLLACGVSWLIFLVVRKLRAPHSTA